MAKDVRIVPADGTITFNNAAGTGSGQISLSGDDLVFSNAVGDVLFGDTDSDVYIGDGVNNVDVIFEQNGSIRGETGSTVALTLGSNETTLYLTGSTLALQKDGGNVGIGTTSPSNKLSVAGTIEAYATTQTNAVSKGQMLNNAIAKFKPHSQNSGTLAFAQVDSGNSIGMQFTNGAGTANWDIAMQPFGGRVGIGKVDPNYTLEVVGTGRFTGNLYNTSTSDDAIKTRFIAGAASGDTADGTLYLQYSKSNPVSIGETSTGGLHVAGNVGIGTTSPSQKLHVDGNAQINHRLDVYSDLRIRGSSSATGSGVVRFLTDSNNKLSIDAGNDGQNLFTFDSSGNLVVPGSVTAQEFHTEFVSASIVYSSGSTKFGDTVDDIHSFTGSLEVSGSGNFSTHIGNPSSPYGGDDQFIRLISPNGTTGTLVNADNGNTWLNADGGKDLWLNWYSLNSPTSNADLQVGDGEGGSAILTVAGSSRRVGIGITSPASKLDVDGIVSSRTGTNSAYSTAVLEITDGGTPSQIKITTAIPFSGTTNAHSVTIRGFQYGSANTVDLQISWHVYNNSFYNRTATSSGGWAPTITLAVESGYVVIHLTSPGYWPKMYVESLYNAYGGPGHAQGWSWADAAVSGDAGKPVETVSYKVHFGNSFVMTSTGNVGIGITTPSAELTVQGSIHISSSLPQLRFSDLQQEDWQISNDNGDFRFTQLDDNITAMYISSSGNVGIGNTAPAQKLHVTGNAEFDGNIYVNEYVFHNDDTNTYMRFLGDYIRFNAGGVEMLTMTEGSNDTVHVNAGGVDVNFQVSTNNDNHTLFVDGGSDKVGIGEVSPQAKLHVSGTNDVLLVEGSGSTIFDVQGSQGQLFSVTDSLVGSLFSVNDISGLPILEVFDTDKVVAGTFGQNTLVVTGSSVGIGTTSPAHKLDVSGTTRSGTNYRTSIDGNSGGAYLFFGSSSDIDSLGTVGAYASLFNISSGNGPISFQFNNTERMRIDTNGNVGIGTTNLGRKLNVEGAISASGYVYGSRMVIENRTALSTSSNFLYIDGGGVFGSGIYINNSVRIDGGLLGSYNEDLQLRTGTTTRLTLSNTTGHANFSGAVSASAFSGSFKGDGSGLTGISANAAPLEEVLNAGNDAAGLSITQLNALSSTGGDFTGIGLVSASAFDIATNATVRGNLDVGEYVYHTTDSNTYMRFQGDNIQFAAGGLTFLEFSEGSSDLITFNKQGDNVNFLISGSAGTTLYASASGNVGIGTISPVSKLHVKDATNISADNSGVGQLSVEGSGYTLGIALDGTRAHIYHNSSLRDLSFGTNESVDMTIEGSSGNVGIGTASPQQKLHVEGHIYLGPNNTNNFVHSGANLGLQADGEVKIVSDVNDTSSVGGSDIIFGYGSSTNTDSNQDFTEAELSTYPRVEVMRIDVSNNRVGIGTSSPSYKLDVAGNIRSLSTINVDRGSISSTAATLAEVRTINGFSYNTLRNGSTTGFFIAPVATNTPAIQVVDSSDNAQDLALQPYGGNVGIGTTTPQKKLDVYLGTNNAVASIGGTIGSGEYAGLHFGYSEVGNSNYRHSAIVFERDDSAFGDARGNIHILNSSAGSTSADLGDARLTIVPSGNVGIGTTAPAALLQIGGGTSNTGNRSTVAMFTGASGSGVVDVINLVNNSTAAFGNGTALNFNNASNYSPTGRIITQQVASGTITDSSMTFQVYQGGLQEVLKLNPNQSVTFNESFTFPTGDGTSGQVLQTNGSGTVTWAAVTTATNADNVNVDNTTTGTGYRVMFADSSGTGYERPYVHDNGFEYDPGSGTIRVSGDVVAYNNFSDRELKDNIQTYQGGLNAVMQLNPVTYEWKKGREGQEIGLIAQEVEQVIPQVVRSQQRMDEGTYKTVDYEKLVAVLIDAVQDQQRQINELKEKLDGLTE